jgi:hypothetical protein
MAMYLTGSRYRRLHSEGHSTEAHGACTEGQCVCTEGHSIEGHGVCIEGHSIEGQGVCTALSELVNVGHSRNSSVCVAFPRTSPVYREPLLCAEKTPHPTRTLLSTAVTNDITPAHAFHHDPPLISRATSRDTHLS